MCKCQNGKHTLVKRSVSDTEFYPNLHPISLTVTYKIAKSSPGGSHALTHLSSRLKSFIMGLLVYIEPPLKGYCWARIKIASLIEIAAFFCSVGEPNEGFCLWRWLLSPSLATQDFICCLYVLTWSRLRRWFTLLFGTQNLFLQNLKLAETFFLLLSVVISYQYHCA